MLLTFNAGRTILKINILGKKITFASTALGINRFIPIEKLILMGNVQGILKERPDFSGMSERDIKFEGVRMFKEKIDTLKTQEEVKNYILYEMESQGYRLISIQ